MNAGVAGILLFLGFLTLFIDKYYSIGQVQGSLVCVTYRSKPLSQFLVEQVQ